MRGQAVKKNGKTGKGIPENGKKRESFRSKKRFPFFPVFTVFNTFLRFLPFFAFFRKRENLSESERRAKTVTKKKVSECGGHARWVCLLGRERLRDRGYGGTRISMIWWN